MEDVKTVDDVASSSTPSGSSRYEVFLSFRGADTRKTFTDHLYNYLNDMQILTFRDNEELHIGEHMGAELTRVIEESTISIPILSKGYASSKWCLRELTHMVKCMNDKQPAGRRRHYTVCPIFYDVPPAELKHQTGILEEAFLQHAEDNVDGGTLQAWKDALKEVAELKGWEKDKIADGHEGKLLKEIVKEVCMKLKKSNVSLTADLVGMDHHMEEMTKLLDTNSGRGVRIVGIHGMGGIGKTTIAKFMYNHLCDHFENQCSFLEDVREKVKCKGYDGLRKQLMSDVLKRPVDGIAPDIRSAFKQKKVLLVIDDVDERSQLDEIIGGREYFGSGSRIIVTTRNQDVFIESEGDFMYRPNEMNFDDSLLLFSKHAFKSTQPWQGHEDISREALQTAAGLPLSLVVIGSMLFSKRKTIWEATLKKLKSIPPDKVQERLKISYDALDHWQKQMFLDIACHFIGEDKTNAMYMWEDCGFFPESGIDVLISLSLITLKDDKIFRMHDQLRDLGRNIVYLENPSALEERSRLWSHEEAVDTLNNQSATKRVQTVYMEYNRGSCCFSDHDFRGMPKLRYLHLANSNLEGDFYRLLPELRWLRWKWNYLMASTTTSIALTNFCPRKLVVLDLSQSYIQDGWESWVQIKATRNLKVLNLSHCHHMTKTPDFSVLPNLERLILESCENLTEIGSSVKHLKRLTYFDANCCPGLRKLPLEFGSMAALQQVYLDTSYLSLGVVGISELPDSIGLLTELRCISLSYCRSLEQIPESFWDLKSLVELDISHTGIRKLSSEGVGKLENLQVLNCSRCDSLIGALPSGIGSLSSLKVLDLSWTQVDRLPDDVGNLCNLRKLNLRNSRVKKLPGVGIERLQKLEELDCSGCILLEGEVPSEIRRLSSLKVLDLSWTEVDRLPDDIGSLCNLRKLNLRYATRVKKLPGVGIERLQKLQVLDCKGCISLEGKLPEGIWSLSSLRVLDLDPTTQISGCLPKNISGMSHLETLDLRCCKNLQLPAEGLKLPVSLTKLVIPFTEASLDSVKSLVNLRTLHFYRNEFCEPPVTVRIQNSRDMSSNMNNLKELELHGFDDGMMSRALMKFDASSHLYSVKIYDYKGMQLPSGSIDLSKCQMLGRLSISNCPSMREIGGNSLGSTWEHISIQCCASLEVLSDLSSMKRLKTLVINGCPKLREIEGLEALTLLKEDWTLRNDPRLRKDHQLHPDLSNSKRPKIIIE